MIRIRKLLNLITENYLTSVELFKQRGTFVNVYINSDSLELSKLLKEHDLRFFINEEGDYVVWNAGRAVHYNIIKLSEVSDYFDDEDIRGIVFSKESPMMPNTLYVYSTRYYKIKNLKDFIENSKLHENLKRIGVDKIKIGESL